jgi:hypothetical protein
MVPLWYVDVYYVLEWELATDIAIASVGSERRGEEV